MTALESDVTDIQAADYAGDIANHAARLAAIESKTVLALDGVLTRETDINGYAAARFSGVNVQIVSGSGSTDGAVNGTGNLIVGYNELRPTPEYINNRTGSHNIVVSQQHNYSSFGGFVAGYRKLSPAPSAASVGEEATSPAAISAESAGEGQMLPHMTIVKWLHAIIAKRMALMTLAPKGSSNLDSPGASWDRAFLTGPGDRSTNPKGKATVTQ